MKKVFFAEDIMFKLNNGASICCTSGGFDPIHFGHISYLKSAKLLADIHIVILNGDTFLQAKKGKSLMNLQERCEIISELECVDYVFPFEIENDLTVIEALKIIKPSIFAKGGDRFDKRTIPEWQFCMENNIEIITNVGIKKTRSSTEYLIDWAEYWNITHSLNNSE